MLVLPPSLVLTLLTGGSLPRAAFRRGDTRMRLQAGSKLPTKLVELLPGGQKRRVHRLLPKPCFPLRLLCPASLLSELRGKAIEI